MLQVGMVKSKNMAKNRRKVTRKRCPVLKPRGSVHNKRSVQTFYARPKMHKHTQVISHDKIARVNTTLFGTGAQKSIIGREGWEIIKLHDTWIDTQGVNVG